MTQSNCPVVSLIVQKYPHFLWFAMKPSCPVLQVDRTLLVSLVNLGYREIEKIVKYCAQNPLHLACV